ncbi:hypothetical protein [Marinobacterium mangrovicola]|uniref:Sulfotransferase family protein n=1 Tax=Marinobacterium mangrovicola TaxID=1476959 RepID=A0A4R1GK55_9GAMM|nr:hypothetical protein [Marinobacterium mangrovicola]TCK08704.1 hypothetical protein CLV83_0796 [Marinobacterium mangrovicola]
MISVFNKLNRTFRRSTLMQRLIPGPDYTSLNESPSGTFTTKNSGIFYSNYQAPDSTSTLLVMGVGRGGTSLVAGLLHEMDIFMGDLMSTPSYEDQKLIKEILESKPKTVQKTIDDYSDRFDIWGFKHPEALSFITRNYKRFRNPRLIFVVKDTASIAMRKAYVLGNDPIQHMYNTFDTYEQILDFIRSSKLPTMTASYEKIMSNPDKFIDALGEFGGITLDESRRASALSFIDKGNSDYELFSMNKRNARINGLHHKTNLYQGHLDHVSMHHISGWAINQKSPEPLQVVLLVNNEEIARTTADLPRSDVQKALNHPDDKCGFIFELPGNQGLASEDTVRVVIDAPVLDIAGSPQKVTG